MFSTRPLIALASATLLALLAGLAAADNDTSDGAPNIGNAAPFRHWYPQYGAIFQNILVNNCSDAYVAWLSQSDATVQADLAARDGATTPGESVVACVLSQTSTFIQANMQSAGVLLGITPFALSVLGSSSEESALLFVIARRPLLTTLILAGSPVVVALRPFEYKDPIEILRSREGRFYSVSFGPPWFVLILEYLVALGALANVIHVTYQLGVGVVTMIWPDSIFLPAMWAASGIIVHVIGALCLRSRLRVKHGKVSKMQILRSEFTLCSEKSIMVETMPERKMFLILSWLTSTSTTFHVIFGTLAFSSMQFISVRDAFGVIGRYTASVMVCRVVLMYELSGLRESVDSIAEATSQDAIAASVDENGRKKSLPRVFTLSF